MTVTDMIPATTPDDIFAEIIDGFTHLEWAQSQTGFMTTGYLGMARHEYLSPDWIAHNALYAQARTQLMEMDKSAAETIYRRMMERFEARGWIANSAP